MSTDQHWTEDLIEEGYRDGLNPESPVPAYKSACYRHGWWLARYDQGLAKQPPEWALDFSLRVSKEMDIKARH